MRNMYQQRTQTLPQRTKGTKNIKKKNPNKHSPVGGWVVIKKGGFREVGRRSISRRTTTTPTHDKDDEEEEITKRNK